MKKIVVLTGAGISAESGISTFRDANGLWENHDIMEVASIQGWNNNPELVLDFYNQRRAQLKIVKPNKAHLYLSYLEKNFDVTIITQNVDDLHERAGSTKIIHLHGELNKVRSVKDSKTVYKWEEDLNFGNLAKDGGQLRPHIVWFGEEVPMMDKAIEEVQKADILVIIGTSLQVYPSASLIEYVPNHSKIICIDPNEMNLNNRVVHIKAYATKGVDYLLDIIKE